MTPKKTRVFYNKLPKDTLLSTEKIIELAKNSGVDFGDGNAQERIRYFIKLDLLPHAVRKSPTSDQKPETREKMANGEWRMANGPIGHLPYSCVSRLVEIDRLYKSGLSYPEIGKKIKRTANGERRTANRQKNIQPNPESEEKPSKNQPQIHKPIVGKLTQFNILSKVGIGASFDIDKILTKHEKNISKIIDKKLTREARTSSISAQEIFNQSSKSAVPKFLTGVKGPLIITLTSSILGIGFFSGLKIIDSNLSQKQQASESINRSLGQVLAATSDEHRLYIDADTEVSGTTLFEENITAPNVLYDVLAGTGIAVSAGQTPTISLAGDAFVKSVNDLKGTLTLKGSGKTSISASGSTLTITTDAITSEADTLATVTGRGATSSTASTFSGGLTIGGNLSLSDTNSTINITNAGTLAFKDSTNTLFSLIDQGAFATIRLSDKGSTGDPSTCTAGDVYFNGTDASIKACTATNTWEALDSSAGVAWSSLSAPTADLSLAHAGYTTMFTFNSLTTGTAFTLSSSSQTSGTILDLTSTGTVTSGGELLNLTANSLTTGNLIIASATSLTTGSALAFTGPSSTGITGSVLSLTSDVGSAGRLINLAPDFSGAEVTSYGIYLSGTDATSSASTTYGIYAAIDKSVAPSGSVHNNYGAYFANTNVNSTGRNVYGVAVKTSGGGIGSYGIYSTATYLTNGTYFGIYSNADQVGAVAGGTVYGMYSNISATQSDTTAYGLFVNAGTGAGTEYAGVFTNGNVGIGDTTPASLLTVGSGELFQVASTGDVTLTETSPSLGFVDTTASEDDFALLTSGNAFAIRNSTDSRNDISVSGAGVVTIDGASVGEGTSVLTLTSGDLTITDGDLTLSSGEFALTTDDTTTDAFTLTASTLTSGSAIVATGSTTTGVTDHFLKITSDVGNGAALIYGAPDYAGGGATSYGLNITGTNSNATGATDYNIYSSLAFTGNSNKTPYGIYSQVTNSSTSSANSYAGYYDNSNSGAVVGLTINSHGLYVTSSNSGAISSTTANSYGLYATSSNTGASSGTINTYGGYFTATGDTAGTSRSYGIYASASGADTNYTGYFAGAETGKVEFVSSLAGGARSTDFVSITQGSNVSNDSSESLLTVSNTDSGSTNAVVDIINGAGAGTALSVSNVSLTSGTNVEITSSTSTAITGTLLNLRGDIGDTGQAILVEPDFSGSSATGYGIYQGATDATSNANTDYGNYTKLALTGNAAKTGYGYYGTITSTSTTAETAIYGADLLVDHNAAVTTGNKTLYGIRSQVTNNGITDASAGTHNLYGAYLSVTSNTGDTNNAYGFYATATTADNLYGGYISFTPQSASGTYYGLYIQQEDSANTNAATALLQLNNADSNLSISNGLEITSVGSITDAIDLDDSDLVNAINIGSNFFLLDGIQVFEGTTGTLTIEDTSGNDLLTLVDSADTGDLTITGNYAGLFSTANSERLCWDAAGSSEITDCSGTPGDYAEQYGASDSSIEAGDLVVADTTQTAYEVESDGRKGSKAWVQKSSSAYQSSVIGVISTDPNEVIGQNFDASENPRPVALNGRVPVKVSAENGPITAGDFITSSSIPGVGMKATNSGRVIGVALQSFDCSSQSTVNSEQSTQNQSCQSKILVFVNPTFYLGEALAANGSFPIQSTDYGLQTTDSLASGQVNSDGTLSNIGEPSTTDNENQILTADDIRKFIEEEIARQLVSTPIPYRNTGSDTVSETDVSAQTDQTLEELNGLIDTNDLTLSTLTLTGDAHLASTQVAGTFSVDGTLVIDYGKQINVLGDTLYLQNDSLAGACQLSIVNCQLLDIGAGALTFDRRGNLKIIGTLTAQKVQTGEITIDDAGDSPTVGSGKLTVGSTAVSISTSALKPGAKVLVTPTTPTNGKVLYVAQLQDFEGFRVAVENGPAQAEIKFDWLIVNTTQISQAN